MAAPGLRGHACLLPQIPVAGRRPELPRSMAQLVSLPVESCVSMWSHGREPVSICPPAHVCLPVLMHRCARDGSHGCHVGFVPSAPRASTVPAKLSALQVWCLSGAERRLLVLTFVPSDHWPLGSDTSNSPTPYPGPHLCLEDSGPLTCVVGDTGPLAASRGAQNVIAVHEEAFVVSRTLGVHNGDVRDDGDCRGGRR